MDKNYAKKLHVYCNLAMITAAIISGMSFVAQKAGMAYVGPLTFNTLRYFIGSICLLPLIYFFSKFVPSYNVNYCNRDLFKGGIIAGLILFTAITINQYCMIFADAGKAGFITSLYIIFVPVILVFLKQKLKTNVKISIVIALAGLYLLCAKGSMKFELWDIFLLISSFFFALHIVVVSNYSKKADTLKLSLIQFLTAGTLSLPLMLLLENPQISEITAGYKPILFIGIVVTAVAYTLQIFGYKAVKPVIGGLILSSEAVFAVLGGWLMLGETLNTQEIAGCIIMAFAIVISQISFKRKQA